MRTFIVYAAVAATLAAGVTVLLGLAHFHASPHEAALTLNSIERDRPTPTQGVAGTRAVQITQTQPERVRATLDVELREAGRDLVRKVPLAQHTFSNSKLHGRDGRLDFI